MRLAERYSGIIGYFLKNNPVAQTELVFRDPYELIVSVVLSAQCTDRRVNMTTPELFKRYPTVRHLAAAEPEEVLELIKSISYPNSKARHLVGLARKLLSDFGDRLALVHQLLHDSLHGLEQMRASRTVVSDGAIDICRLIACVVHDHHRYLSAQG